MNTLKSLLRLQALVIAGGVLFSWGALMGQFGRFYDMYGTFFRFRECVIPNPMATPCFYGAMAFLASFVWATFLVINFRAGSQKWLSRLLLFGVVFALSVLSYEFLQYYHLLGGPIISCTPGVPPWQTPCFVGFLFFVGAFTVSLFVIKRQKVEETSGELNK